MTPTILTVCWILTGIVASLILVWEDSDDIVTLKDFFVLSAFSIVGGSIFLFIVLCCLISEKGKNIVIYRKRR